MDTIDRARQAMEAADEEYEAAAASGASNARLDELAQRIADAEGAYHRACDFWQPADCSGVIGAGGLVYSDADPGL